jgi:hypothetical protein
MCRREQDIPLRNGKGRFHREKRCVFHVRGGYVSHILWSRERLYVDQFLDPDDVE